jgi:hypothetical protein
MFAALVQAKEEGAFRAYGCVTSFLGRRDMLSMAFACYPKNDDPQLASFPKLLETINQFSARRNEIAHGITVTLWFNQVKLGVYLKPAAYNSRKRLSLKDMNKLAWEAQGPDFLEKFPHVEKYAYTAAQIDYYREQFLALKRDLVPIWTRVRELNGDPIK